MKAPTLLFTGSLLVNGALLALLVRGATAGKSSAEAGVVSRPAVTESFGRGQNHSDIDPKIWSHLQPAELSGFFFRLRAVGVSPATARALVTAQVRDQFAPRRAALNRAAAERPFWEPTAPDPTTAAALGQLAREENQAIRDWLGPDAMLDESQTAVLQRQFPRFSEAKIAAIQRSRQEVNEKMQELLFTGGEIPPAVAVFMKQREADIALLLTPEEREEYDLRAGNIAYALRDILGGFDPTEQEFRDLHRLARAYEETAKRSIGGVEASRPVRDAEKQHVEQMKATLGEQRWSDYLRSIDGGYQQTARLTARLELPVETANQVYAVQKEIQQRAVAFETDRTISPEARNAQLSALATEAQSKITALLGARGFEAYKQYGGSWVTSLQPRVVPAARPAAP